MKKLRYVVVLLLIVGCLAPYALAGNTNFPDVNEGDWFYRDVEALWDMGRITGYPDGTFRPNDVMAVAEFLKLAMSCTSLNGGLIQVEGTSTVHWADKWFEKAVELDVIDAGQYPQGTWDAPITRYQMAEIAVRLIFNVKNEQPSTWDEQLEMFTNENKAWYIADWNSVPEADRDYVLQAYAKGLVGGLPDKTFGGDKTMTRAEGCKIALRIMSTSERLRVNGVIYD